MTLEQQKAEAYVRKAIPELMELSFGCVVRTWRMGAKRINEDLVVLSYKKVTDKIGIKDQLKTLNPKGNQEIWGNVFEDVPAREVNFKILGHPIQLQHWLRVLGNGTYWYDTDTNTLNYLRYQSQPSIAFNLTTGQPATEADYKAFNDIVCN